MVKSSLINQNSHTMCLLSSYFQVYLALILISSTNTFLAKTI